MHFYYYFTFLNAFNILELADQIDNDETYVEKSDVIDVCKKLNYNARTSEIFLKNCSKNSYEYITEMIRTNVLEIFYPTINVDFEIFANNNFYQKSKEEYIQKAEKIAKFVQKDENPGKKL
ncbi:hypothetical protein GVAV_001655 [Gurleya vavrai]